MKILEALLQKYFINFLLDVYYNKSVKTIQKTAIKQAVLTALYVTCVASFMYFGGQAKLGRANIILVPITMLLIFVFSASLTGYLLFGKPILMYLNGKKKHGKATEGFGAKRDRRYLETDILPPDFTENWMANIAKVQKEHFSIIVYENWKNIRTIWGEMEKYWKVKNMLVWHLPNRHQGFSAKYKFFSKHTF